MDFRNRKTKDNPRMINMHEGHRQRLRESLNKRGWEDFEDYQILEYILSCVQPRKDTNPLAHTLIEEFGTLANVLDASVEDLKSINGVGERIATFLSSYPYIFKCYKKSKCKEGVDCSSPRKIFDNFANIISHMPNEEFYLICVDGDSKLISYKMISRGTKSEVSFTLKTITETAIRNQAFGVILLHNHPNADCRPSEEDIEMTKRIFYSMYMNGIYLIDHIITCKDDSYFSFCGNNYFEQFENEAKVLMGELNKNKANSNPPKYIKNDR